MWTQKGVITLKLDQNTYISLKRWWRIYNGSYGGAIPAYPCAIADTSEMHWRQQQLFASTDCWSWRLPLLLWRRWRGWCCSKKVHYMHTARSIGVSIVPGWARTLESPIGCEWRTCVLVKTFDQEWHYCTDSQVRSTYARVAATKSLTVHRREAAALYCPWWLVWADWLDQAALLLTFRGCLCPLRPRLMTPCVATAKIGVYVSLRIHLQ